MGHASDAAQAAVDGTYAEFGVPANYIPPSGPTIGCTIIIADEDRQVQFGGTSRAFAEGGRFEVRASEVASPVKQGAFALLNDAGGEISRHAIIADPMTDDPFRLVWLCTVRQ